MYGENFSFIVADAQTVGKGIGSDIMDLCEQSAGMLDF